jgi:hypothetical protein
MFIRKTGRLLAKDVIDNLPPIVCAGGREKVG